MKQVTFILLFILLKITIPTQAQEQSIQLKMQKGYEYIFERTEKIYSQLQNGTDRIYQIQKKKFKITVDRVVSNEEIILGLTMLENKEEDPSSTKIDVTDYFFPGFYDKEIFRHTIPSTIPYEPLFCLFKIQFSLNLNSRKIKIVDRVSLLENYYSRLIEQGYDDKERKNIINYINEDLLKKQAELVSFLLWFHNTKINSENFLVNSLVDDKLIVREAGDNFISLGEQEFNNLTPGRWYQKYWLDTENGFITDYSTIKIDSVKSYADSRMYNAIWNIQETQLKLLSCKKIQPEILFVKGKIENPLSNKVHIRFLEDPFGIDLKTVTTFLDEDNLFEITFPFTKKGLIYFENENNNKHNAPGTVVMYAEPGDSLIFEASGENFPWNLKFDGNRIAESSLILELRSQLKLEYSYSMENFLIFDNESFFNSATNFDVEKGKNFFSALIKIESLLKKLSLTDNIASKYEKSLDENVSLFITNEVKSYFKYGIYRLLHTTIALEDYVLFYEIENIDEINYDEVRVKAEKIDVVSTYNDYGLQSRKCINTYINYHYQNTNKFSDPASRLSTVGLVRFRDVEQGTQFARLLLYGSPLYREIASQLIDLITFTDLNPYYVNLYSFETANRYLEIIIRSCNDTDVIEKAKHLLEQQQKINSGNFIPDIDFVDLNNNVTTYYDFKGKPTVFYISTDWVGERYMIEQYVKENSHVNFVMAAEGNNFREWKEYTNRGEPLAKHLFFKNDSITFKELFLTPGIYLIFDKAGSFIGFDKTVKQAFKKAEASLEPQKKEIDKSTLRIIILVLGFLLLAITLTLIIGRWRAHRRLKKEQQSRRLRELELTAIRSQMNPHFLFNSLNSVQNLIQQNKGRQAHLYLSDFAGLIRKVLKNSEKQESSLAEELEMVEQYLNLEKLRFDFDFSISVGKGIDAQNTMLPSMLLQPFTENAVIHGLQNKPSDRNLKIEVDKTDEGIKVTIEDNGIGREAAKKIQAEKNGKGIKMNEERLDLLREKYGEKYQLEIKDLDEGTRVEIIIPEEK